MLLMIEGYNDSIMYDMEIIKQHERIQRKSAAILSDVVNLSMGGKGAAKSVFSAWPIDGDSKEEVSSELMKKLDRVRKSKNKRIKNGTGKT